MKDIKKVKSPKSSKSIPPKHKKTTRTPPMAPPPHPMQDPLAQFAPQGGMMVASPYQDMQSDPFAFQNEQDARRSDIRGDINQAIRQTKRKK